MKTLALVAVFAILASAAVAFDLRSGTSIAVPEGTNVADDLLAAGSSVRVAGGVQGSAFVAGQSVSVLGPVSGTTAAAGQTVRIGGAQQTVMAAGQTVDASGLIAQNAALAGQNVTVDEASRIRLDLMASGENVDIRGRVGRTLRVAGQDIEIRATVAGNVYAEGENISVLPGAVIAGDFIYQSVNPANIAEGATIRGDVVRQPVEAPRKAGFAAKLLSTILFFLMSLLFGIVLIALFPRWSAEAAARVTQAPGWAALWGFITLIVTPIAMLIALITVIGVPLGLTLLALYPVALMVAVIISALVVGTLILRGRSIWLRLLVGLAIIFVLGLIPYLGGLVCLAVLIFGLGGLAMSIVRPRSESGTVES